MSEESTIQGNLKLAPRADWLLAFLLAGPFILVAYKLSGLPGSAACSQLFSLAAMPAGFRHALREIFFVPIGAIMVVLFHLTLGLRVLGLFRPILIAYAFGAIGTLMSAALLIPALVIIALIRPLLRGAPYYARVPILLSLVAALLLAPVMAGQWWRLVWLEQAAYFPVIALCLTCESFARVLDRDGLAEAAWQTVVTLMAALVIVSIMAVPGVMTLMFHFPELLVLEAGAILLIARHLNFQLLEGWNPLQAQTTATLPELPQPNLTSQSLALKD